GGDAVSQALSAGDALGSTLSYSATGLPGGLSVNSSTGVISGTVALGADANSPYTVTVTASNGTASASQTFAWAVSHLAFADPGLQTGADGTAVAPAPQARHPAPHSPPST